MSEVTNNIAMISVAVGVVSTAVTLILALLKWKDALREQTRRVSLESARLAWELANALHDDPVAGTALDLMDGETTSITCAYHGEHVVAEGDVLVALSVDPGEFSEKGAAIRLAFDSMFYVLDRMRSAMNSGLIRPDDFSSATYYYCDKLVASHRFVLDYGTRNGYGTTARFVENLARSRPEA